MGSALVKVAQSSPTLCDPMDYTVHGVLQARILEWVAFPFSRDLPELGIEPGSPALQADSLPNELSGKPRIWIALMLVSRILHLGETLTCKLHMGVHIISSNCCELTITLNLKSNNQKKKSFTVLTALCQKDSLDDPS